MSKRWGDDYSINKSTVDIPDHKGLTWLHRACLLDDKTTVKELIDAGAKINARDHYGNTPLKYALYIGNDEMVQILLEAESDMNSEVKLGVLGNIIKQYINKFESSDSKTEKYKQNKVLSEHPKTLDDYPSDSDSYSSDYGEYAYIGNNTELIGSDEGYSDSNSL